MKSVMPMMIILIITATPKAIQMPRLDNQYIPPLDTFMEKDQQNE